MMNAQLQPLATVSQKANRVLIQALGVTDTLRFLSQFSIDTGNYTKERQALFAGQSAQDIMADIKTQRNTHQ